MPKGILVGFNTAVEIQMDLSSQNTCSVYRDWKQASSLGKRTVAGV